MLKDVSLPYGLLPVEVIRNGVRPDQWGILMQHALCLACLDGNSFPDCIEQYVPEAYANLWANSALPMQGVNLPLLYPETAADAGMAGLSPSHAQYGEMDQETRNRILDQFLVDPRGVPTYVKAILDKATDVLGGRDKAEDWIDQFSGTLGDYPRRLAATKEGTDRVLLHLAGISRHGHD